MLNIIIGARFDGSLSTPGRAIEVQAVVNKEQNVLHFRNVDEELHSLESRSQHIICKIELIHIFPSA